MNYRHAFHAGNICDCVKHIVLPMQIKHLRAKDKGFCIIDTHAGIGLYDLQGESARKTGEAEAGIQRLLAAPRLPEAEDYYRVLEGLNPGWNAGQPIRFYPGSPLVARQLLRPQDRLIACELHPEDFRQLRRQFHEDGQVQAHHRDGYEALGAFLPPSEKRGLVLIDPPYEATDEFDRLVSAIAEAYRKWPQGSFMIWYPIKDRPALWRFHEKLAATGIPAQLCAEFVYWEETRADRLNGCGFIFINPPWQMDEKLRALFPALHEALHTEYQRSTVKWLTGEG